MALPPGAYVFAEADYMYGVGPLTLRIDRIDHAQPVTHDRDVWLHVDGVELDYRGVELGHRSARVEHVGAGHIGERGRVAARPSPASAGPA